VTVSAAESFVPVPDERVGALGMTCVRVQGYGVSLVDGLLRPGDRQLLDAIGDRRALVVTTPTVARLYGAALRRVLAPAGTRVRVAVMHSGEPAKEIETVLDVCAAAQEAGIGRRDVLVAFGGGVCCDVVTLAAGLIRRGVAYLTVPTTLVGQVDAGIGLKGGVNFAGSKNYLGCFHAPEGSLVDLGLLRTLPEVELRCGLAEILKMALVRDPDLFALLGERGEELVRTRFAPDRADAEWVAARAIELMLAELEPNCYEDQTLCRLVDFGHTISPALEERSGHRIRHAQAVAIDMALSCEIATELGWLAPDACATVLHTFRRLGLPLFHPLLTADVVAAGLHGATAHRGGELNLVLPTSVGTARFLVRPEDLPASAVAAALRCLRRRAR
jgi:2-epi-5-epi-valiolone synthase